MANGRMRTSQASWMWTLLLLLLLLQHNSKRSLVSGCQSTQLATSRTVPYRYAEGTTLLYFTDRISYRRPSCAPPVLPSQ